MKTANQVEGSKRRRRKTTASKNQPRAPFIGSRPLKFPMTLRGEVVEVKLVPAVSTTTHVNYEITISRGGKVLEWVPTRAELQRIGRAAGMRTQQQTSH